MTDSVASKTIVGVCLRHFSVKDLPNLGALFLIQCFTLGKLNVKGNVQESVKVIIFVVGHPFARLSHSCPWPGDLVAANVHLVTVQVSDVHLKAHQSIDK